jgi:hypothetical protein
VPNLWLSILGAIVALCLSESAACATTQPPQKGLPASAKFVSLAPDPRGGDNGFNTFKRLPDGKGISFGGFSHNRAGNNAVAVYDPVANSWKIVVPNTPWVDGPKLPNGSLDVTNRPYLGNRDNHNTIVVGSRNELWVLAGQRGIPLSGNVTGVLNLATWKWEINDDPHHFAPVGGRFPSWANSASGWIDALNVGYVFGGATGDNPFDGLARIDPNPAGPAPFTVTEWAGNRGGGPAFPGAERLRSIGNSQFVRNGKVHVYGGGHMLPDRTIESGHTLYEIDVMAASMRVVAVNPLPPQQRVAGQAIFAYYIASRDLMVTTDGTRVNVYDYSTDSWTNVPVTTGADPDRRDYGAGFYSPEVDMGIVMYRHARVYGLRLEYSGATDSTLHPPPAPIASATPAPSLPPSPSPRVSPPEHASSPSVPSATPASTPPVASQESASTPTLPPKPTFLRSTGRAQPPASTLTSTPTSTPTPSTPPNRRTRPLANAIGNLILSATAVPYVGSSIELGYSKHLDFARLGNRWYKMAGDHPKIDANTPEAQDGRQEILSFNATANDWREDQKYYIPDPTQIQLAFPDDAFTIVRKDEAWVFVSARAASAITQVPGMAQQIGNKVMAWNATTKRWRAVMPMVNEYRGNRAWRGIYDPVRDRFVIPAGYSGLIWVLISGDGEDMTQRSPTGTAFTFGDHAFHVAGLAADFPNRVAYAYDHKRAELWAVDLDTLAMRRIADIPEPPADNTAAIKIAWHPDLRAVVIAAKRLHAYEVDTGALTSWERPDGFTNGIGKRVRTSTIFFDPDTRDVISIGGIDWDTRMNPGVYWRLSIKRK